jgi:transposase
MSRNREGRTIRILAASRTIAVCVPAAAGAAGPPPICGQSSHSSASNLAVRLDAVTAPAVFDGPIDKVSFRAYVDPVPVPTLRPGDVVVLDNLAVHKQPEVRAAVEAARSSDFSTYNPDFNLIELAFAKLKALLRAARPRSFDQVTTLMAIALRAIYPT